VSKSDHLVTLLEAVGVRYYFGM